MKNNILKFIGFFVMVAFIASCEKEAFEDYSSTPAAAAPTLTVTIDSNTDSAMTVSYNMNVAGRVTLAVVPTSVDTPSIGDLESRVVAGASYIDYFKHDAGDAQGTKTYTGLMPYTQYRVFAIGQNRDGVPSEMVITGSIRTQDFAIPVISSFSPAKGAEDIAIDADLTLTFSEPVTYVSGKNIRLSSDGGTYDETILAASLVISGNVVTIEHGDWPYGDYINLEIEEGAFIDASGNACAAINLYPTTPNYWFETMPEIYFENITGHYYVASENEIGFGNGERGGYWVDIEQVGDYEIAIYDLRFSGATLVLTLDPSTKSIVVADQWTGIVHGGTGQDIMASDTDAFGVGASTGIVPGSYDDATGELIFFTHYYIAAGYFGFYTYELQKAIPPKGMANGPKDNDFSIYQY
mgnify:CR=1 FL=1